MLLHRQDKYQEQNDFWKSTQRICQVNLLSGAVLLGSISALAWNALSLQSQAAPIASSPAASQPTASPPIANKTAVEIGPEEPFNVSASSVAPATAQMTELTEPDGTTVILPPGYQADRAYPALVLMPYTDRTALHMFNWAIYDAYHRRRDNSFVVIMPPGQGSSAHWSGAGWESLVNEYETYVQQDLDPIAAKYNVDPNQMVIGGFSLGGDLSWALSLRNPAIFSGAIVMGSMSNYRDAQSAQTLSSRDFRYFMVMGGYDGNRSAMHNALDTLDRHAIDYQYEEVSSAGHGDLPEQMHRDLFLSAMDYVLSERRSNLR